MAHIMARWAVVAQALLLVACAQALSPASLFSWATGGSQVADDLSALQVAADGVPNLLTKDEVPANETKQLDYQRAKEEERLAILRGDGTIRTPTGVESVNDNAPCGQIDNETGVRVGPCNHTAHRYRTRLPSKPVNFTKMPKPVVIGKVLTPPFTDPATGRRSQTATDVIRLLPPPKPKLKPLDAAFQEANPGKFQCDRAVSCQACVARESSEQQCGWCSNGVNGTSCMEANPDGTAPVSSCDNDGSKWQMGFCPGEKCKGYYTCDSCLKDPFCGWCQSENKCIEGDETGPLFGTCGKWEAHTCPVMEPVEAIDKRIVEGGKPIEYGDCCTPRFNASCSNEKISFCVCKRDPYCCNLVWDDTCIKHVQDFDCGICPFQPCPNECMGNGVCQVHKGECKCDPGWGDIDCGKEVDIVPETGPVKPKKKYPVKDTRRVNRTAIVANRTVSKEVNESYTRMADQPEAPAPAPVAAAPAPAPAPAPKKKGIYAPAPPAEPFPEPRKKKVSYNKICYTSAENCTYGCNADQCRMSKYKNYTASLNCSKNFANHTDRQASKPQNASDSDHLQSNGDSWSDQEKACCGPECQRQKAAMEKCQANCSSTCQSSNCFHTFTNTTYPEFSNASKITKADAPRGLFELRLTDPENEDKPAPAPAPAAPVKSTKNTTREGVPAVAEPGSNCTANMDTFNETEAFAQAQADGTDIMKRTHSSNQSCSQLGWNPTCYQGSPTICMQTQHLCSDAGETACEDNGCTGLKTFEQAKVICEIDQRARLCTKSELLWNKGINNPCKYNKQLAWTDTRCGSNIEQVIAMDAAGELGENRTSRCVAQEGSKVRAMVVCCADSKPIPLPENNGTMAEINTKRNLADKNALLGQAEKSGNQGRIGVARAQVEQAETEHERSVALREAQDKALENKKVQLAAAEEMAAAKLASEAKAKLANETRAKADAKAANDTKALQDAETELRAVTNGSKASTATPQDKAAAIAAVKDKQTEVAASNKNASGAKAAESEAAKEVAGVANSTAVKRAKAKEANATQNAAAVEANLKDAEQAKASGVSSTAAPKKSKDEAAAEDEAANAPEFPDSGSGSGSASGGGASGAGSGAGSGSGSEGPMSKEDETPEPVKVLGVPMPNVSNISVVPNVSSGTPAPAPKPRAPPPAPAPAPSNGSVVPGVPGVTGNGSVVPTNVTGGGNSSGNSTVVPAVPGVSGNSTGGGNSTVAPSVPAVPGVSGNSSSSSNSSASNSSAVPAVPGVTGGNSSSNSSVPAVPGAGGLFGGNASAPAPAPAAPAPATASNTSTKASEKSGMGAPGPAPAAPASNSSAVPAVPAVPGVATAPAGAAPAPAPATANTTANATSKSKHGKAQAPAPAPAPVAAAPAPVPAGLVPGVPTLLSGPAPAPAPAPAPEDNSPRKLPPTVAAPNAEDDQDGDADDSTPAAAAPAPATATPAAAAPAAAAPAAAAPAAAAPAPAAASESNEDAPAPGPSAAAAAAPAFSCPAEKQFLCARNLRSCRNVAHATEEKCNADPGCGWSAQAKTCLPKPLTNCLRLSKTQCESVEGSACQWHKATQGSDFCASNVYAACAGAIDNTACSAMPECLSTCQEAVAAPAPPRCPITPSQQSQGMTQGLEPDFMCFRDHSACRAFTSLTTCMDEPACGWAGSVNGCVNKPLATCYMLNFESSRDVKCNANAACHWSGNVCLSEAHVMCNAADSISECKAAAGTVGSCSGRFTCPSN